MKKNAAFTLVEILFCLAIMAILLVACGVAFQGATGSYFANQQIYNTVDTARMALMRMTNEIRTAVAVSPTDPANKCSLVTTDGKNPVYRYDSTSKTLFIDTGGQSYPLCMNVTAMTITRTIVTGTPTYVKSVQMSMTVGTGNSSQTIASAATLRKTI